MPPEAFHRSTMKGAAKSRVAAVNRASARRRFGRLARKSAYEPSPRHARANRDPMRARCGVARGAAARHETGSVCMDSAKPAAKGDFGAQRRPPAMRAMLSTARQARAQARCRPPSIGCGCGCAPARRVTPPARLTCMQHGAGPIAEAQCSPALASAARIRPRRRLARGGSFVQPNVSASGVNHACRRRRRGHTAVILRRPAAAATMPDPTAGRSHRAPRAPHRSARDRSSSAARARLSRRARAPLARARADAA